MILRCVFLFLVAAAVCGCSAVGQLTVKDYTAKSGERVMAGQAEPKAEYECRRIVQEKRDWGIRGGLNPAAAVQRATQAAVDEAPGKGANYAYIIVPKEVDIGGFDVNAFADAEVAYYSCAKLP
jgi:hypothetical protein